MNLKKNVCFYYPSHVLGGAEMLFTRIANYLANHTNKNIFYVDYEDGISNEFLNKKVKKIHLSDELSLSDNTVIISAITLAYELPKIINKNIQYLFWNIHPENIWWLKSKANINNKNLICFLKNIIRQNGLISMDSATNLTIQNLIHNNTPIVPVMLNDFEFTIKSKLISENELNIVWLSRLDTDKIYSLLNLMENLKNYKTKKKIILKIIGDGDAKNLIDIEYYSKYFKIVLEGIIKPPKLHDYLKSNADCVFSMGTSLLEASKIGIPSVLCFLRENIDTKNDFVFLHKINNHSLGAKVDFYEFEEIKEPLNNILNQISNNIESISILTRKHFYDKFLIDSQIQTLINSINICQLNYLKRDKTKMRVDFFQKFCNLFKNKSIKFFKRYQNKTNKKILIFVSSYSPFGNMKQRPEHLFKQFINDGYIIAWSEKSLNEVVELAPNIYGFPMKDSKRLILSNKIKNKVVLSISTHYTFDNIEKIFTKASKKNIKVIYEHLDDITLISDKNIQKKLYKRFNIICKNNNIIISTTADNLYKQAVETRGSEKNIIMAKNGVDLEIFDETKLKPEFTNFLNKPIIGYYGCIVKEWFDFETFEYALKNNPHLNFVLIGMYNKSEISHLLKYDNFLCLDKMPFEELLKYSKHFSVATIPFLLNEITAGTSPVKMFEYMAQGLPIVTTAMNECKNYKSCLIANNKEEYSQLLNKALELKDNKEYQLLLQKEATENSWENVYKIIKSRI